MNSIEWSSEISTIVGLLMTIIGALRQYKNSRDKISERKKNKDVITSRFDWIDMIVSYIIVFIEKRTGGNNIAEFARLNSLVEAIKRKYLPDLVGVVKVNGSEKLIIDLTSDDTLVRLSKLFGTGLFQEANDELLLDEGLYIPSVIKYKGDDDLVDFLHKNGISECHFLPFIEMGLMTGYLIMGYTTIDKVRLQKEEFRTLKKRINKVKINFRKT